jgi:hypothetical protein
VAVCATVPDEGRYLVSERTMYVILDVFSRYAVGWSSQLTRARDSRSVAGPCRCGMRTLGCVAVAAALPDDRYSVHPQPQGPLMLPTSPLEPGRPPLLLARQAPVSRSLPAKVLASAAFWGALSAALMIAGVALIYLSDGDLSWWLFYVLVGGSGAASIIRRIIDPGARRRGAGDGWWGGDSWGGDGGDGDGG